MIDKTMEQPTSWWADLLKWIENNMILFLSFTAAWKVIDRAFKFFSESRDARIRQIVKDEMRPLDAKLDKIGEAIFELKTHK